MAERMVGIELVLHGCKDVQPNVYREEPEARDHKWEVYRARSRHAGAKILTPHAAILALRPLLTTSGVGKARTPTCCYL